MAHTGKIKEYDTTKGSGSITPEKGGDALHFAKADLQMEGAEPKQGQHWEYETKQVDGSKARAVNLRQQEQGQGGNDRQKDQAAKQQG